jgi:hypothetical protein
MPAVDYAALLAVANQLIKDAGQDGWLSGVGAPGGTTFDPTEGAPFSHPARFVMLDFTTVELRDTRILATDKKVLLAPGTLPIVPTADHALVEADGTPWQIVPPVKTLRPSTITLLYTLQVR